MPIVFPTLHLSLNKRLKRKKRNIFFELSEGHVKFLQCAHKVLEIQIKEGHEGAGGVCREGTSLRHSLQ